MLNFKEIKLEDKVWVDELLQYSDYYGTEYCFTTLFIWRKIYKTEICRYKDFLLIRSKHGDKPGYIFPAGKGTSSDIKEIIDLYSKDAEENFNCKLSLHSVTKDVLALINNIFPDQFDSYVNRNTFDYIYNSIDMLTLKGKKFQSKRNHLARFVELPNWSYEVINSNNLAECVKMNAEWCALYGCNKDESMEQESCAVRETLNNFSALKVKGGLLRLDGKVIAYTIGEMLNKNTFIVHIEKAFAEIRGAYPTMSREFIFHQMVNPMSLVLPNGKPNEDITIQDIGFEFINREDDAGDEGLRKAKMQFHPAFLLEKWVVNRK